MGIGEKLFRSELSRMVQDRNLVPFIGAGMSQGAGLPGWYGLLQPLADEIGYALPPREYVNGEALIEAAQAYVNQCGLHRLTVVLKERLDTTDKKPSMAHEALAALPVSMVMTANYDDLLERAFRQAGKRVHLVVRDADIPFMKQGPEDVSIVKLYGDLSMPETLVLARQQYERFFLDRPLLVSLLKTELSRADFLYLGWSHSDPHFGQVFGELLQQLNGMNRRGLALMLGLGDAQEQELARKNLAVMSLPGVDPNREIADLLLGC